MRIAKCKHCGQIMRPEAHACILTRPYTAIAAAAEHKPRTYAQIMETCKRAREALVEPAPGPSLRERCAALVAKWSLSANTKRAWDCARELAALLAETEEP